MTKPSPTLPNPFLEIQTGSHSPMLGWFGARPAWVVLLLCLGLGLPIVGWRANWQADDARARARAEALARSMALELQFDQAVSAVETLGVLARQSGGTIPNFQRAAAEVLATHRGLASLELQPGGVVSDIAPRTGNERAFGLNVLKHPVYGPSANATIQKRALTLTGPLTLYDGDAGLVARLPIFLRGRDGRDAFWGFVAASMRLPEALALARVEDLAREGYHYVLFLPAAAKETAVTIAAHGGLSVPDAVQQPVHAHDLELRLAVQRPGGWLSKTRLLLECVCVLAGSGLLSLVVNLLESRHAVEMALSEANRRLAGETADKRQAQDECRATKDEASATRAELDRTRSALQSSTTAELRLQAATRAAEETARAGYVELEQLRKAHQQAEQTIANLQAQFKAADWEEGKVAHALQIQPDEADVMPAPTTPPPLEAPPARKPPRAARRKAQQPENQMDLFKTQPAAVPVQAVPAGDAAAKEQPAESLPGTAAEPSPPSTAIAPAEPAPLAADATQDRLAEPEAAPKPKEERQPRALPAPPLVNPALLRKAVNQILPLFTGKDSGARDCLKANRATFRSAFTPEAYVEFEQSVKSGDFSAALEHLKKATRRHGIAL